MCHPADMELATIMSRSIDSPLRRRKVESYNGNRVVITVNDGWLSYRPRFQRLPSNVWTMPAVASAGADSSGMLRCLGNPWGTPQPWPMAPQCSTDLHSPWLIHVHPCPSMSHGSATEVRTLTPTSRSTTQRTAVVDVEMSRCRDVEMSPWVSWVTGQGDEKSPAVNFNTTVIAAWTSWTCAWNWRLKIQSCQYVINMARDVQHCFGRIDQTRLHRFGEDVCFTGAGILFGSIWFIVRCTTFAQLACPDSLKRLLSTCTLWGCSFQTRSEHWCHCMPWTCTWVNIYWIYCKIF